MAKAERKGKPKSGKHSPQSMQRNYRIFGLIGLGILLGIIVVVASQYLANRGEETRSPEQQALEYDAYAAELLEPIKVEMSKTVSPYKFMLNSIREVEDLLWKGLDLDTTLTTAWEKLGYINAQFHGKQALLRYESYREQGKQEKMKEEERNTLMYFAQADVYFDKALEFGHAYPDRIYYEKAEADYIQYNNAGAIMNLTKALELNPRERKYKARLIEIYLYSGRFNNALRQIDRYRKEYPDSELPYRHLGGYYMFQGDSATAVKYYMEAIELGTRPEVGKLLYKYFSDKGDTAQASYYLQKAFEAEVNWNPNQY